MWGLIHIGREPPLIRWGNHRLRKHKGPSTTVKGPFLLLNVQQKTLDGSRVGLVEHSGLEPLTSTLPV